MRALSHRIVLAAATFTAVTTLAHAQQPGPRDGSYIGIMTEMPTPDRADNEPPACVYQRPVGMTIDKGVVTVSYSDYGGNLIHFRGSVTPGGAVQAWHTNGDGTRSILTGRFASNGFVAYMARDNQLCPYVLNMSAQR
jgi:hypothetical protein